MMHEQAPLCTLQNIDGDETVSLGESQFYWGRILAQAFVENGL